ncbi:MAG: hypothetical protein JNK48_28210 [Bryobacterales bacterium]|nr:hypothetical protein [Bryobacterales bacterium]
MTAFLPPLQQERKAEQAKNTTALAIGQHGAPQASLSGKAGKSIKSGATK